MVSGMGLVSGGILGAYAAAGCDLRDLLTAILMSFPATIFLTKMFVPEMGVPETLTAEFADLVEFGEIRQDWRKLYADAFAGMDDDFGELSGKQPPANPSPPRPLPAYLGTYTNDYWGSATVAEQDGALTVALGPRPDVYPLRHWDGDVFTLSLVSENFPPSGVSKVSFAGNAMTVEFLDGDKMGTFTR